MTDKFRRTHPLNITVTEGESPTGAKLTAIASQARVGARLLEKAIGDLWNQSGDSILTDYPLQIPNLARTVGQNQLLNPTIYYPEGQFTFVDRVGSKFSGKRVAELVFKPESLANCSAVAGSTNLTNKVASLALVVAAGDWFVDVDSGRLFTFSQLDSTDKLSYVTDPEDWILTDLLPGVIPDPDQTTFTGCRISSPSSGVYYLHLPPRQRLPLTGYDLPDRYPTSDEVTDNSDTSVVASPTRKLWQSSSSTALASSFYRYRLPTEISSIISSLGDGEELPAGFLYLWNQSTRTVIEDVVLKKTSNSWVYEITSASTDFSSYVSASEAAASYTTPFSIITVGASLASSVAFLARHALTHDHSDKGTFSAPLPSTDMITYLDHIDYGGYRLELFGNGSDGDVTISSGTTTLSRDMYYRNLTISGTGSLVTNGYKVFVSGTLDLSAAPAEAITAKGGNGNTGNAGNFTTPAAAATAGTSVSDNTVGGSAFAAAASGMAGYWEEDSGNGIAGSSVVAAQGNGGASGTAGGGGSANGGATGGAGGSGATPTNALPVLRITTDLLRGVSLIKGGAGGAGGGGGGSMFLGGPDIPVNGGAGGSGGAGGGVLFFAAYILNRGASSAAGSISAKGGNGGTGGNGEDVSSTWHSGGGGGGSGGGGGWIYGIVGSLTGATATDLLSASGGTGGTGGTGYATNGGGDGGAGGDGGRITLVDLSKATITQTVGSAGSAGTNTATGTGGAGGTGGACNMSL